MSSSKFIADRLREVFLSGHWIANTNYREMLEPVSREQACTQIGDLNTIAVLTFHIHYYVQGVLKVLQGGELTIRDKYSFDLPPLQTEEEWLNLKNQLSANAEIFAQAVESMPDDQLDQVFVQEKYGTWRRNLEAILEHSYYHMGQISLIRKLVTRTIG